MDLRVTQGSLLAAWPDLMDPNFMHSVVLMCQHTEDGAYGLVLNRPTKHGVDELLPDHPLLGRVSFPVFLGGPVSHETMQFVHTVPKEVPGGFELCSGLYLGGDLDALGRYLIESPELAASKVRLFLGYSGWGTGQLEGELAVGSWVPAPYLPEVVFADDPAATWKQVVRAAGKDAEGLDAEPPDPSWN